MVRYLSTLCLFAAFAGVPALVGCDKTTSKETTTVRDRDGEVKKSEKVTTESPNGTVKETTSEKTVKP